MQTRIIKLKGRPIDWQKKFKSLEDFTEFLLDHNYELIGITNALMRKVKMYSKQKRKVIMEDHKKKNPKSLFDYPEPSEDFNNRAVEASVDKHRSL